MDEAGTAGPLAGLRVVEFLGIGPGPHCAMLLADLGADVLRIEREGGNGWPNPTVDRGRATLTIDIRTPEGRDSCLDVLDHADVLIEGFRPGVMERLGLGPDVVHARNPGLVYGRTTGWGQEGPLARVAGHDINYIALTGALAAIGRPGEPAQPPLNLVGDFGGGSMFLAFGIMVALWERHRSGKGQVVDAAMVDGVTSLMTMFSGLANSGLVSVERDRNVLAGASPFYRSYICADGKEVSVGPVERHFYELLLEKLGEPADLAQRQYDPADWPATSRRFEALFARRTQAQWCALLEGTDACFAPVLKLHEAPHHPHMKARGVYAETAHGLQPVPAPRFSRTPAAIPEDREPQDMIASWRNGDRT